MSQPARERITEILGHYFGEEAVEKAEAGEELFASHGALNWNEDKLDSLDRVEFVMAVEDAFDVEIGDDEANKLKSLDDVVRAVESKLTAPADR